MSTDFGVDSSSRFAFRGADTHRHTSHRHHWSPQPRIGMNSDVRIYTEIESN